MDEPADDILRKFVNVSQMSIDCIVLQDGDNLVVSLVMIQQPESPDRPCPHYDVTMSDILLGKHTNIQRIPVSFYIISCKSLVREFSHVLRAICPRKEAIKRWNDI